MEFFICKIFNCQTICLNLCGKTVAILLQNLAKTHFIC